MARSRLFPALIVAPALLLGACSGGDDSTSTTVAPTTTRVAEPGAFPADPVDVTFASADGAQLQGKYYPAAANPAPLVVLYHWEMGDMEDWYEVANWLQNRGTHNQIPTFSHTPFLDGRWFPTMPAAPTYNVFIATFQGCSPHPDGCPNWTPDKWLADAQGILQQASGMPGVDADRIITIGAGIGADAAVDACSWWNDTHPAACDGAFTLSPGSYLGKSFGATVAGLGDGSPVVPVWCVTDGRLQSGLCDAPGVENNSAYRKVDVDGATPAAGLLVPEADPNPLDLLIEFLALTVPM